MEVNRYADLSALSRAAAKLVLEDCQRVLARRDATYTGGVSGGRIPAFMFEALADLPVP